MSDGRHQRLLHFFVFNSTTRTKQSIMKAFIALAVLFAVAAAAPTHDFLVAVKQDTSGRYKVEYDIGEIAKTEERMEDGTVRGYYTYIDGDGHPQKIEYMAGEHGFQVMGTNLPIAPSPVQDTAEVAHARHEHLTTFEEIRSKLPQEYMGEYDH